MSDLADPPNILAMIGILMSVGTVAFDWLWLSRKRLAYRVQLDNPISLNPKFIPRSVRFRLEIEGVEIEDASLVLLRVENAGSQHIEAEDFESSLGFTFEDRTVIHVEVPESDPDPADIRRRLNRTGGLNFAGGDLTVPPVSLNKRDYFKLLVLLSGDGSGVKPRGFIKGGKIVKGPRRRGGPKLSVLAVGVAGVLLLGLLAGSLLTGGAPVSPGGCATGRLDVYGSTAFESATADIAAAYQNHCPGASISVDGGGSAEGVRKLQNDGEAAGGGRNKIAMSDGKADDPGQLVPHPIGVVLFSVVVNPQTGVESLTTGQLKDIYSGRYTNWTQLGGNDHEISLIGRDADSGTRDTFQHQVLKGAEPSVSSADCATRTRFGEEEKVLRCERSSTTEVLDTVGRIPGALGYAEKSAAFETQGVATVKLDGSESDIQRVLQGDYPFWTVEYFYTYGKPGKKSLTRSFLDYMAGDTARSTLLINDHVPCKHAESGDLCNDDGGHGTEVAGPK